MPKTTLSTKTKTSTNTKPSTKSSTTTKCSTAKMSTKSPTKSSTKSPKKSSTAISSTAKSSMAISSTTISSTKRSTHRPRPWLNAFALWSNRVRPELIEKSSKKLSVDQISDKLKNRWKRMTTAQRKPFYEEAGNFEG